MSISVIVPVFNESENIDGFLERITKVLEKTTNEYEIIFVLDPSEDDTEQRIKSKLAENPRIKLIKFSRRFGQPAATLAGIKNSSYEKIVFIDVDLQDPPELIVEMYENSKKGFETILAKRRKKKGENPIRKFISNIGYYLISKLSDTNIPMNVGEYRMISRRVANEIIELEEKEFFLRGINSFIGFSQKILEFDREPRSKGETKYNKFPGSLRIGLNGIFSFSTKPLHFITILSTISFIFSLTIFVLYLLLTALKLFVFKYQFFIITLILLVSSLIFFSLGIISEYLARIIPDIKKRPTYIIEDKFNFKEK